MNKLLSITCWLLLTFSLFGQQTEIYQDFDRDFKTGVDLFNKQKYGAAQNYFGKIIEAYGTQHSAVRSEAEYYYAICALELFNSDTEFFIMQFLQNNPSSPKTGLAYFQMGRFKYRQSQWSEAAEWFGKTNFLELDNDEISEYYFKLGYAQFMLKDYEEAKKNFAEIKDTETKYTDPALYYYSHLAYEDGNYETALNGFAKLSKSEKFAPIAPYYISQIYFNQQKYDKLLEYAPKVYESASKKRKPEIAKMIGEAYYQKGEYKKSLDYLEQYANSSSNLTADDHYQLGYTFYRAGQYGKAITYFSKVTGENDTVAQNAYYHLGDCYIKEDRKNEGMQAFKAAMQFDIDEFIKHDSHFNYVKLAYELDIAPFNEATKAVEEYIQLYPKSENIDQANSFLVKMYISTNDYKSALSSLNKIQKRDSEMDAAYQKIAYYHGIEEFSGLKFEEAVDLFNQSLKYKMYDKEIAALASYWKAESFYRLGRIAEAQKLYNEFVLMPSSIKQVEYKTAHYNLGYTYFQTELYYKASTWFRKYTDMTEGKKTVKRGDAFCRTGDCFYMQRKFTEALDYYEKAIRENTSGVDYAMYQKGLCYGLQKEYSKKMWVLRQLDLKYPKSDYRIDALYETAQTYLSQDDKKNAAKYYQKIVDSFPQKNYYVLKSLVKLGLVYYSIDEKDKSVASYKKVIEEHPKTQEAKDALLGLKNVYIAMNKADEYLDYISDLGNVPVITEGAKDSMIYAQAENLYMDGDYEKGKEQLIRYLNDFPNGYFMINAHYYKADCEVRADREEEALRSYEVVISNGQSSFKPDAITYAARISKKLGKTSEALRYYMLLEEEATRTNQMLEARRGQMDAYFETEDYVGSISAAKKLLQTAELTEEDERMAHYVLGVSYEKDGKMDLSLNHFATIATDVRSAEGAEAKYKVSYIYFDRKEYDKSEKEILEFLDMNTSQHYWLGRAYLLWSDIYFAKDELFQAKYTLQGVTENYPVTDDGILEMANMKLKKIEAIENAPKEEPQVENIDMEGSGEYQELFDEGDNATNADSTKTE